MIKRRYPIGAEVCGSNETHFRVWAPKARTIRVVWKKEGERMHQQELTAEAGGYFSGMAACGADSRYKFRVDGGEAFPDPASRSQPDGPHGFSCVVDPFNFSWKDQSWNGVTLPGQIIYEFHVGTFTASGTWEVAIEKLSCLKESGITLLEMMPIADFPGRFGWGYDGVDLFAPCHLYGAPDDLRAFVDAAHAHEMGVILDVVYNHFGPDGNYLGIYSDDYVRHDRPKEWGDPTNFDGPNSAPVREFFLTNARYWIEEFHFDGFRFDATHGMHDESEQHIVGEIGRAARAAAGPRNIVLVAENELQEARLVRSQQEGGDDFDGVWNDDWHYTARVALTDRREAYHRDYKGSPQEFISAAKYGYLFQGQPSRWRAAPRGHPAFDLPPHAFVSFLENHDQISNNPFGERVRLQTSPGRYRALTALLLLGPWTPLLFQGQEFGASTPFLYFAEVGEAELQEAVREGRFNFLTNFPSGVSVEAAARLAIPHEEATFQRSKLEWSEREPGGPLFLLHRDLIQLRREDQRLREQIAGGVDGAVLGAASFALRFFSSCGHERLIIVNFGGSLPLLPAAEPLLAPPEGAEWELLWTSESPRYGGGGMIEPHLEKEWTLPAEASLLFRSRPSR